MKPITQRIDKGTFDPTEEIPKWAHDLIDAHNKNAEALEAIIQASGSTLKDLTFSTGATVDASFPKFIALPFTPARLKVAKARNLTDLTTPFYECEVTDWQPAANGVSIRYISGLSANQSYVITIEAIRG